MPHLCSAPQFCTVARGREATWQPDGTGFSTLTLIDAAERAASVRMLVQ
jgi:penicillin-binding protein 1C